MMHLLESVWAQGISDLGCKILSALRLQNSKMNGVTHVLGTYMILGQGTFYQDEKL